MAAGIVHTQRKERLFRSLGEIGGDLRHGRLYASRSRETRLPARLLIRTRRIALGIELTIRLSVFLRRKDGVEIVMEANPVVVPALQPVALSPLVMPLRGSGTVG